MGWGWHVSALVPAHVGLYVAFICLSFASLWKQLQSAGLLSERNYLLIIGL